MAEQVGVTQLEPIEKPSGEGSPHGGNSESRAFRLTKTGCLPPACGSMQPAVSPPVRPALLVRAARHYEGAEQILIRQAVMTAQHFVSTQPVALPAPGQWVVAECPARVDFSGESLG